MQSRRLHLLSLALATTLAGCAAPQPKLVPRQTQFDEAEYAPYRKAGTGKITGQVFLKTVGGDIKYGAGNKVTLNPATTHGREWMGILESNRLPAQGDPRAAEFQRITQCDGFGNFEFPDLPPGTYCLVSGVTWDTGVILTGSTVVGLATVEDGKNVKVMLTR